MNSDKDPRIKEDPSADITTTDSTDVYKMHIQTVENECSGLFAEYMKLYNQDPSSEITKNALESFNARYDHLKTLQGVLNVEENPNETRVKRESPSIKRESPAPNDRSLIDQNQLLFLQLQDDSTKVEKRSNKRMYRTTREFCDDFESMLIENKLNFSTDWERVLPLCLNNQDNKWFQEELANKNYQWKDVRQLLIDQKRTGWTRMVMMMEVCNFRQSKTESVRSYANKYQKRCKEAHIKDGTMLAAQFLVSLQEPVQKCITAALQDGKDIPRCLSDMVQFVIENDTSDKYQYITKRSERPSKKLRTGKIAPCTWCGKPFTHGHTCQEFYDHKNKLFASGKSK